MMLDPCIEDGEVAALGQLNARKAGKPACGWFAPCGFRANGDDGRRCQSSGAFAQIYADASELPTKGSICSLRLAIAVSNCASWVRSV
jgi:hypothetical protein